jgi:N-acetylglucosaminyldiphosphoundecaprenol N-acetyl-beta-D-mannosaminyltransferase
MAEGRIYILNVPVDRLTFGALLDHIAVYLAEGGRTRQFCTVNPEFVMLAQRDPEFMQVLHQADLCLPDGIGLLWAARRIGRPLPERVTGSDSVPRIAERAAHEGWRLYLLGGEEGVAEEAARILGERYPGLQIVGTYAGSPAPEEEGEIVARVNASDADILFVAYGAPRQDKWIARNRDRLRVGVAMGVGGSLDFVTGAQTRAPRWMRRLGLEWLDRLIRQPWRWRRQLALPRFFVAAILRRADRPRRAGG